MSDKTAIVQDRVVLIKEYTKLDWIVTQCERGRLFEDTGMTNLLLAERSNAT